MFPEQFELPKSFDLNSLKGCHFLEHNWSLSLVSMSSQIIGLYFNKVLCFQPAASKLH